MKEYYKINIAGREERLPVISLPSGIRIAFLNLHGNPVLTECCGKKIAEMLKNSGAEILLTAESKGLQLTHVVSRELGHSFYAVARKERKVYMGEFIETTVNAITGEKSHKLYLSSEDRDRMKGKKIAIVDDVISSGGSLAGMEELAVQSGGEVVARACVLAEGNSIDNKSLLRLADLPLI